MLQKEMTGPGISSHSSGRSRWHLENVHQARAKNILFNRENLRKQGVRCMEPVVVASIRNYGTM